MFIHVTKGVITTIIVLKQDGAQTSSTACLQQFTVGDSAHPLKSDYVFSYIIITKYDLYIQCALE